MRGAKWSVTTGNPAMRLSFVTTSGGMGLDLVRLRAAWLEYEDARARRIAAMVRSVSRVSDGASTVRLGRQGLNAGLARRLAR